MRMWLAAALALSASAAMAQDEAGPRPLRGMVTYLADAARFADCMTGQSLPVAMEGAWPAVEAAYLEGRPGPGEGLMATLEGSVVERPRVEGEGTEPTLVVARFIAVWPMQTCERSMYDESLQDTYWKILRLGEAPVGAAEGRREPHLILRSQDGRYAATVGCNQLVGGFSLDGASLTFGQGASTMMACPPPLDAWEQALAAALARAARWQVVGPGLELFDEAGASIALFQAVHFN
jgi:heat shock protein HslJ